MRRPLRINLDQDLPARATPLGADATSQIFGGCVGYFAPCREHSDCCLQYLTSGSTLYRLACVGASGSANGQCRWQ